jgi:hypothetical protein
MNNSGVNHRTIGNNILLKFLQNKTLAILLSRIIDTFSCQGCQEEQANQLGHSCLETKFVQGNEYKTFYIRAARQLCLNFDNVNGALNLIMSQQGDFGSTLPTLIFSSYKLQRLIFKPIVYNMCYGSSIVVPVVGLDIVRLETLVGQYMYNSHVYYAKHNGISMAILYKTCQVTFSFLWGDCPPIIEISCIYGTVELFKVVVGANDFITKIDTAMFENYQRLGKCINFCNFKIGYKLNKKRKRMVKFFVATADENFGMASCTLPLDEFIVVYDAIDEHFHFGWSDGSLTN